MLLIIGNDAAHRSQFVARLHALSSTADVTANAGQCSYFTADCACHTTPPAQAEIACTRACSTAQMAVVPCCSVVCRDTTDIGA